MRLCRLSPLSPFLRLRRYGGCNLEAVARQVEKAKEADCNEEGAGAIVRNERRGGDDDCCGDHV